MGVQEIGEWDRSNQKDDPVPEGPVWMAYAGANILSYEKVI
jgi:hypothetical protein